MKVAIIIVTYNGSQYIERCLASVFASIYAGEFNVIVVDNASTDGTVDLIKRHPELVSGSVSASSAKEKQIPNAPEAHRQVRDDNRNLFLIELKTNTGFVGGNNTGIALALEQGSAAVVLLNQDTYVEPDWLEELTRVAQSNPKIGIVQAMLLLADDHNRVNNLGNAWHYLGFGFAKHYRALAEQYQSQEPFAIGYASGAAMLIKRKVLEAIGLFDDKFFSYHEDLDLCWRARLAGYEIVIAPQATVYHHYHFNRNKLMYYWTERNRWAVLLQNYSLKILLLLAPLLLAVELMILVYSVTHGWLMHKLRSYGWILSHLPAILKQRFKIQSQRVVSDKVIMRGMDASLEFSEIKNPVLTYIVNPVVQWYYRLIV